MRRLALVVVVALCALAFYYYSMRQGRYAGAEDGPQIHVSVTQELALGRQATPYLIQMYGGLNPDPEAQRLVEHVGGRLLARSTAGETPYRFTFYLLADAGTVNAFALPGGPVFITTGLGAQLRSEGEIAGTLAHLMGHVINRNATLQLARMQRTGAWPAADVIEAYDSENPDAEAYKEITALIRRAADLTYQRDAESQADTLAVRLMAEAGYDPHALAGAFAVLEALAQHRPAFFHTHPNPPDRIEHIQHAVDILFPDGVPRSMVK